MPQNQPMYRHIADDLRAQIKNGTAQAKREAAHRRRAERQYEASTKHRQGGYQAPHGRRPA